MKPKNFGYIYSASNGPAFTQGLHKIGSTNNIQRRMQNLSGASGVFDQFHSHSWFRLESPSAATKIEKAVHAKLEALGLHHRKEFFQDSRSFHDAVSETAFELGEICMSNYWLETEDIFELCGSFVPCAYFLLSEDRELRRFCLYSYHMIHLLRDAHGFQRPYDGYLAFGFDADASQEFLRANARIPYVCALLREGPDEQLKKWAKLKIEEYEDILTEVFEFDPMWRDRVSN